MLMPPPNPPTPFRPPTRRRSDLDIVATILLSAIGLFVAMCAFYLSAFFAMATDACSYSECNSDFLVAAYAVAWGGIALAIVGTTIGIVLAVRRGTPSWWWPLMGILVIIVTFVMGAGFADMSMNR